MTKTPNENKILGYTRYNGRTTNPAMHRPPPKRACRTWLRTAPCVRLVHSSTPGKRADEERIGAPGLTQIKLAFNPLASRLPPFPGTHPYLRDRAPGALPCRGRHASGGEFDSSQSSIQTAQLRCFSALPNPTARAWASTDVTAPAAPGRSPIFSRAVTEPRAAGVLGRTGGRRAGARPAKPARLKQSGSSATCPMICSSRPSALLTKTSRRTSHQTTWYLPENDVATPSGITSLSHDAAAAQHRSEK
jgi:hypothetical protein